MAPELRDTNPDERVHSDSDDELQPHSTDATGKTLIASIGRRSYSSSTMVLSLIMLDINSECYSLIK